MVMNCGWGSTALTMWEEVRTRGAQADFLMLPVSSRDWRWVLDRFFLLGFAVTVMQFLIYALALGLLEPAVLDNFLRWSRPPSIRALRLLFHALVVWLIIGFFWSGYWASVWRGWPLGVLAMAPFVIAGVGYLSVARYADMRLALGGMGTILIAFGFLIRHRVGRLWTNRAAVLLLPR